MGYMTKTVQNIFFLDFLEDVHVPMLDYPATSGKG